MAFEQRVGDVEGVLPAGSQTVSQLKEEPAGPPSPPARQLERPASPESENFQFGWGSCQVRRPAAARSPAPWAKLKDRINAADADPNGEHVEEMDSGSDSGRGRPAPAANGTNSAAGSRGGALAPSAPRPRGRRRVAPNRRYMQGDMALTGDSGGLFTPSAAQPTLMRAAAPCCCCAPARGRAAHIPLRPLPLAHVRCALRSPCAPRISTSCNTFTLTSMNPAPTTSAAPRARACRLCLGGPGQRL